MATIIGTRPCKRVTMARTWKTLDLSNLYSGCHGSSLPPHSTIAGPWLAVESHAQLREPSPRESQRGLRRKRIPVRSAYFKAKERGLTGSAWTLITAPLGQTTIDGSCARGMCIAAFSHEQSDVLDTIFRMRGAPLPCNENDKANASVITGDKTERWHDLLRSLFSKLPELELTPKGSASAHIKPSLASQHRGNSSQVQVCRAPIVRSEPRRLNTIDCFATLNMLSNSANTLSWAESHIFRRVDPKVVPMVGVLHNAQEHEYSFPIRLWRRWPANGRITVWHAADVTTPVIWCQSRAVKMPASQRLRSSRVTSLLQCSIASEASSMACPLLWENTRFFYGIGNSPAVSLTNHLAVSEDAKVLLLGCGDPRSILFSLYSEGLHLNPSDVRRFDFTCCDWEPPVLARNLVLFSLLMDNNVVNDVRRIWNIYYHFFVDAEAHALLLDICTQLHDSLASMSTWHSSRFGTTLRVASSATLDALRRYLAQYIATGKKTGADRAAFRRHYEQAIRAKFAKANSGGRRISPNSAAGGPLLGILDRSAAGYKLYEDYWATGVVSGTPSGGSATAMSRSLSTMGQKRAKGYHLAEGLAEISPNSSRTVVAHRCAATAMQQFTRWAQAFHHAVTNADGRVKIRLLIGHVVPVSRALLHAANMAVPRYICPWSLEELLLDGPDYTEDTISPAPRLSTFVDKAKPVECIHGLCAEIRTMAVLLGISPRSFLEVASSSCSIHAASHAQANPEQPQLRERIAWIRTSPHNVEIDATLLANILHGVYREMTRHEDWMTSIQELKFHMMLYTRESFVHFLREVQLRVVNSTTWHIAMNRLMQYIETASDNRGLLGRNSYQDLCLHLHLLGVHDVLLRYPAFISTTPYRIDKSRTIFRNWPDVPPVVCVTLEVPRAKFAALEALGADAIGNPNLAANLTSTLVHVTNDFYSVHAVHGSFTRVRDASGRSDLTRVRLIFAEGGWNGCGNVLVVFQVPAWILMIDPDGMTARLTLRIPPQPALFMAAMKSLGPDMAIFSANVKDAAHVAITREAHHLRPGAFSLLPDITKASAKAPIICAIGDSTASAISRIRTRVEIPQELRATWLERKPVKIRQTSPCSLSITSGTMSHDVSLPARIRGNILQVKNARASMYCEIEGPIGRGEILYMNHRKLPSLSGIMHRVYLDVLPRLDLSFGTHKHWLPQHIAHMFSDHEASLLQNVVSSGVLSSCGDTLADLKNIIQMILSSALQMLAVAANSTATCNLPLRLYSRTTLPNALLILNSLRLDLGENTVVLDAEYIDIDALPDTDTHNAVVAKFNLSHETSALDLSRLDQTSLDMWSAYIKECGRRCASSTRRVAISPLFPRRSSSPSPTRRNGFFALFRTAHL
ncbi:hypothetical protein BKA62DRAFT_672336 [Auriculariales sp. MPI-PUGE-AT-0066]|nr:hypothetical protein BKA62DRAFT_672336 [Auriculariales sp. MPI-PUGE-AT-0066]